MKTYIIYKHTLNDSGKSYIGLTSQTLQERFSDHIHEAKFRNGKYHFHRALRKYGFDNITSTILKSNLTRDEAGKQEIYYIKKYDTVSNGYNENYGGFGGQMVSSEYLSERVKKTQWSGEVGKKRRELHSKLFSGANNPGSKTYEFITDNGEKFIINCLKDYCKENNLVYHTVRTFVNKGKIIQKSPKDHSFKWNKTKQFIQGWEIIEITKGKNI